MTAFEAPRALKGKDTGYTAFDLHPSTPVIGAEIRNLRLSNLSEKTAEQLRHALWRYGVLFLRDQFLSHDELSAAGRLFGPELENHTFGQTLKDEGYPEVLVIEQFESDRAKTTTDIWHHDVTGRKNPNLVSVLQATEVPFGADTMWSSASAAFEWLPDALKRLFLELDIEHDAVYMALRHDFGSSGMLSTLFDMDESNIHPAVIRHPETGQLCLFVGNGYVKRIKGFSAEQSEQLIKLALDQVKIPELQVRYSWQPGDIAIWDNLGTVHYGVAGDLRNQRRLLHRVAAWSPKVRPSLDRKAALAEMDRR
jgi:taurine dioxygenase